MISLKKTIHGVIVALIVLTAVRLVTPLALPEIAAIEPGAFLSEDGVNLEGYRAVILEKNIFDQQRQPLLPVERQSLADESVNDEANNANVIASFRLTGVSHVSESGFALIETGSTVKRFEPGETLPDGSTLVEVIEFGIRISGDGRDETIFLFGRDE